jgi:Xaa-Pro aminopeptidase
MERLEKLYRKLQEKRLDCFVVTKPVNIFYLLGIELSVGMLVVEQGSYRLYLDSRYKVAAEERGLHLSDEPLKERFKHHKTVAVEGDHLTLTRYQELVDENRSVNFKSEMLVEELRMVKDPHEIQELKKAANRTKETMKMVLQSIHEGVTEEELETLVRHPSFTPIIAFGSNSAHVHHRPTNRKYRKGEAVLVDLGVKVGHYMGDMTRTISSPFIQEVKEAHDLAIEACRPGCTLEDLDRIVKDKIPFKDHSLSHGIGLEVHERPFFKSDKKGILLPNMVITIEPGLYTAGIGGARYESMVQITETGCEVLTGLESFI